MLASELTSARLSPANRSAWPAVASSSRPAALSFPPSFLGLFLQFQPVSLARLGVREHRVLRDLISFQCLEPTL